MNKKAFSLIEVLISVSIIIILAIVATTTSNNLKNNSNNSKVISDLNTIENALVSYKTENQNIPLPGGNNNFFDKNGNYIHSLTSTGSYGVYGKITQDTIPKRFIDVSPLDPRTNQYYSYGITKEDFQFEIAGVIGTNDNFLAKVTGSYTAEKGPYSLIKEYNGPNFVVDRGSNLPYNPNDRELIVTDSNGNIYKSGDTINNNTGGDLTLYFSDGSTSLISNGTIIIFDNLDFPKENNLVSKVNLFLQAGSIWTKATKLGSESSFDIYTSDLTASVRGTIFKVEKIPVNTEVIVTEGTVDIYRKNTPAGTAPIETIVLPGEMPKKTIINKNDRDEGTPTIININISAEENRVVENKLNNFIEDRTDNIGVSKIDILEETGVRVDSEPKDCYLEDRLVENGKKITGYKEKSVKFGNTCSTPIERECRDGKLNGDTNYKYASCYEKQPNMCSPYIMTGYSNSPPTPKNATNDVVKIDPIYLLGGYEVGNKTTTKTVKCIDGVSTYNETNQSIRIDCDAGFIPNGYSCKCNTGTDFYNGACYENPFGADYELVKVIPIINGYYSLNSLSLGSGFGIVFDTDGVNQTSTLEQYLYDYTGPDIVYSIFGKIKLSINGEGYPNIVKYSSDKTDTNQTLKLKFNGTDWDDLGIPKILNNDIGVSGTPVLLNSQNLKIMNASNIRIFKKIKGPIPGEWYSGKGCNSCPGGKSKIWGLTYKCKDIEAEDPDDETCTDVGGKESKWKGKYNPNL